MFNFTESSFKIVEVNDEINQTFGALNSFNKNYHDIKEANTIGADKYFHAKANCQASQYGKIGEKISSKISDFREDVDLEKNKHKKRKDGTKMTPTERLIDYRDDHSANLYGRLQGWQNPNIDCRILIDKYRPNGLDDKY